MVEDDLKEIEKNVASSLENNSNKEKRELLEKQEELVEAQKELADAQIKLTEQEEEKEESKPGEKQKTAKAEKATIEEAEREEKRRILIKKHPDMKEFFENADADTIDFHHKKLEKPKKNSGLGSSGAGSDPENTLKVIMFILSIIVIFADSILTKGFNRNFNYAVYYIGLYLFLSLAYFFLHMIFVKNEMKESFRCLAIGIVLSVLQIVILWFTQHDILKNLLGTAYPPVAIIIMLLAPWLFYFIFINHIEGRAATWIRVLLFAFIIMVFLFFSFTSILTAAKIIAPSTTLASSPWDMFKDFGAVIGTQVTDIKSSINESINARLHPEGAKSKIDQNSRVKLGVFLKDMKILQRNLFAGESIDMIATMTANSLFKEIRILTSCYATSLYDEERVPGEIEYNEFYVLGQDAEIIQCSFPLGLEKGRYKAYFDASFNFETWGYLDYTFVDRDLATDYLMEDKDINQELDIEKEPIPIFTDGPAKILMIAAAQPLQLDFEKENSLPHFAIVLEDNWDSGEITKVDRVLVQMPKMINLTGCIPKDQEPYYAGDVDPDSEEKSEYFHYYVFNNPDQKSGILEDIVCRMDIDKNQYYEEKGLNQKLVKTAVVSVNYQYSVPSKSMSFDIKEART